MVEFSEELMAVAERISQKHKNDLEGAKQEFRAFCIKCGNEEWIEALVCRGADSLLWSVRGAANYAIKQGSPFHSIPKLSPFSGKGVAEVCRELNSYFDLCIGGLRIGSATGVQLKATRDQCYAKAAGYRRDGDFLAALAEHVPDEAVVEEYLTAKQIGRILARAEQTVGADVDRDAEMSGGANGRATSAVMPKRGVRGRKTKRSGERAVDADATCARSPRGGDSGRDAERGHAPRKTRRPRAALA